MKRVDYLRLATSVLALLAAICLAADAGRAQELNSNDSFDLYLSHPVTVAGKTLQPGTYRFEPLNLAGGDAPVLVIRSGGGRKAEVSASVSATYTKKVQPSTGVLYHRVGNTYYFDRIWVKGQNFGYKFALPDGLKARASGQ